MRDLIAASPTPEEALEPVLRALLEGTGGSAGAICFYDQRAELLRLAAEAGLSDEGCRRLRTVRRGDTLSWDMPLQSLFNRRVYLIESASRNRYVPPLVEQAASVRTVACLPLYVGSTALGSLVVVSVAPQCFTERHLRLLELPLRELIGLIERVRMRPAHGGTPPAPTRPAPAPPLPRAADTAPARAALEAAEALVAERELELAAARTRVVELETAATAARTRIAELEAAAAATRARIEQLETDAVATREQLVKLVDEAKVRARTLEAELVARTDELEAVRRERAAVETARVLASEEELIRAGERIAELEAEAAAVPERVSEGVQDAESRLRSVTADLQTRTAELEACTADQRRLEQEVAARSEECRTLGAELETRSGERDALATELEARTNELASRSEALEARTAELTALAAELETLRVERAAAASVPAAAETPATEGAPETAGVIELVPPGDDAAAAAPAPAVAPPTLVAVVRAPAAAAATQEHDAESVLVVDADPAWERVALNGHRILVRKPGDPAGPGAGRLIANLAATGAIDDLVGMRGAGCNGKIWGCVADPAGGRALPLGPIEPAARPFDLEAVLASLSTSLPKGARVVTVGADVDVLVSLRQALARQGVSVSMAWDGKQADDLLAMVRPQLVVLDLGLPQNEGYRILGRMAAAEHVPTALVVGGENDPAGFAALLKDPTQARRIVPFERIVSNVLAQRTRRA